MTGFDRRHFVTAAALGAGAAGAVAAGAVAVTPAQAQAKPLPPLKAKLGHEVTLLDPFSSAVGQGEAVVRDSARGVNFAGSDPRCDGAAIPQAPAF